MAKKKNEGFNTQEAEPELNPPKYVVTIDNFYNIESGYMVFRGDVITLSPTETESIRRRYGEKAVVGPVYTEAKSN
ncbi:MAG: hypothetical protein LBT88_02315 [Oscillospiraceae bacterium]|jgi:hypothetical protein|nr:hypothetical protein [Oscillospiraceae bacterium]